MISKKGLEKQPGFCLPQVDLLIFLSEVIQDCLTCRGQSSSTVQDIITTAGHIPSRTSHISDFSGLLPNTTEKKSHPVRRFEVETSKKHREF